MTPKGSTSKMPALVDGAGFFIILTNPYKLAHKAFRDRPSQDKVVELSRMVVNTGDLRFVRIQISIINIENNLYAWMHQDMLWMAFLESVVENCALLG